MKRIDIKDIRADWLNARCLNLMARYALHAADIDGTKFRLKDEGSLADIVDHAHRTDNEILRGLYLHLKVELKAVLSQPKLKEQVEQLATEFESNQSGQHVSLQSDSIAPLPI